MRKTNFCKILLLCCLGMTCVPTLSRAETSPPPTVADKDKPNTPNMGTELEKATQENLQLLNTINARVEYCKRPSTRRLLGDLGTDWSVGSHVSTQVLKYD